METIFSNCDGCNRMDDLTEYNNELLCNRCLQLEIDEEDNYMDDYMDDDDGFFIEDGF